MISVVQKYICPPEAVRLLKCAGYAVVRTDQWDVLGLGEGVRAEWPWRQPR